MEPGILNPRDNIDILYLFLYETVGTFLLVTGVSMANGLTDAPFVIISFLFLIISITGRVSGAHFNGAVTIGIYVIE